MDINWFPGHMARTLRELKQALKQVDMVIELCDARIPESSRNPEIADLIRHKPSVLVLNKSDMADPAVTAAWLSWYKARGQEAVDCNSTRRPSLKKLVSLIRVRTAAVAEQAARRGRINRAARVLVVGIPNTGKSTLINCLAGRNSARTEARPGVTRSITWIRAGDNLEMMDSPGVLWPRLGDERVKSNLAATGAIRDDILPLEEVATNIFFKLSQAYPALITSRYDINPTIREPHLLFEQAARSRSCLLRGGRIDTARFAGIFLEDLRSGRIGRISLENPDSSGDGGSES